MKRVFAFLSALCLLITFLPAAVTAETYENLTYSVSDGEVTITDCVADATGELTIPATIADYPVTTIGLSAFADCTGLTAITLGENVTTIGESAFSGCTGLTSITIGAKVTSVGSGVFAGCSGLAAITVAEGNPVYHSAGNCLIETSSKTVVAGCKTSQIPTDGSVTAIGRLAFYKCAGLTTFTVPDSVLSIGVSAFEGCTGLTAIALGSTVKSIGNSAFLGCTALTGAVIPDSVETMGVYVFSGCTKLATVEIGDNVAAIGNSAFSGCTELVDVTIGAGVKTIDVFAFNGCSKLAEVTIPEGVTTIGKFAFYNCAALTCIKIPNSISAIGSNAFAGCDQVAFSVSVLNDYAIAYAQKNGIPYTTLGSLDVTTVSLRPSVAGVYFSGDMAWAENNAEVLAYGFAVSTTNPLPVADGSEESSLYTQGSTSVLVSDIMKTANTKEVNASNATQAIYARAYVQLTDGTYMYGEAVQVTLRRVVIAAQSNWDVLSDVQKEALLDMYDTYSDVMASWKVPNLKTN